MIPLPGGYLFTEETWSERDAMKKKKKKKYSEFSNFVRGFNLKSEKKKKKWRSKGETEVGTIVTVDFGFC